MKGKIVGVAKHCNPFTCSTPQHLNLVASFRLTLTLLKRHSCDLDDTSLAAITNSWCNLFTTSYRPIISIFVDLTQDIPYPYQSHQPSVINLLLSLPSTFTMALCSKCARFGKWIHSFHNARVISMPSPCLWCLICIIVSFLHKFFK